MNSEDNKFNDTTRNTKPQDHFTTHSTTGNAGNKDTETPQNEKSDTQKTDTKEQIGNVVDNIKPYAAKAWAVTQDLAEFVKEKAPDIIDALKKGFQESKETVKEAYDKFQKHRDEKANTTTTSTTSTTSTTKTTDTSKTDQSNTGFHSGSSTGSTSKTDSSSKQNPSDPNNKPKNY